MRRPTGVPLSGRWVQLERVVPATHGPDLWSELGGEPAAANWTYLPVGPFPSPAEFLAWLAEFAVRTDPLAYAIVDRRSGRAVGLAAYLRIDPSAATIEVGWLNFGPSLQRTAAATEALFLLTGHAFDLGFRRYEWKCDVLNERSRKAAGRLGFTFEGVFRNAAIVKGRNRDTAWFSMIDTDWPPLAAAITTWLEPGNFVAGKQLRPLSELTAAIIGGTFPQVEVELVATGPRAVPPAAGHA